MQNSLGTTLYNALVDVLSGENIDPSFFLVLASLARMDVESRRPWQVLRAKDTSQIALSGLNPTNPYSIPKPATASASTPAFMRYLEEGAFWLVNTANANDFFEIRTIPFESQVQYTKDLKIFVDYAKLLFYILGMLNTTYTINQFFIADFGDIQMNGVNGATADTSWVGFPARFASFIVFQAAARYRLGTDWDDIAARNGDDNYQASEQVYKAMVKWDSEMALATIRGINRGAQLGGNGGTPPVGGTLGFYPNYGN